MATSSLTNASQAPRPILKSGGRLGARMREYETYVMSIKAGQVGKLRPGESESDRAVAIRVSRAAKRIQRAIRVWSVDGTVYFALN